MNPSGDLSRTGSGNFRRSGSGHRSGVSAKSRATTKSQNSISVTLPHASGEDFERLSPVHIRSLSPERQNTNNSGQLKNQHTSVQHSLSPQSYGTVPPQSTPQPTLSQEEIRRIVATRIIETAWMAFRDRQMFKLLKHAVCAAEHSLSYEILRKVSPKEAELLKDKCMPAKVRFRFGGLEFPPMIFFKIFASSKQTGGMGIRYVSGKKMIKPASEAARDAYGQMGARLFYDQCMQDTLQQQTHKVSSDVDVTTLKDYMHLLSMMDELPAKMGGRDNSWRKLTLEVLPRSTIFYDVVQYLYNDGCRVIRAMTPRLQAELPQLLMPPLSQELQLQHIQIISQLRPIETPTYETKHVSDKQTSSRRSRQARLRVLKMKKVYEEAQKEGDDAAAEKVPAKHTFVEEEAEEDWEEEADKLYQWTKELSMDDMNLSYQASAVPPVL